MQKPGQLPSVVIVGRSNVGKSTLFNKIAEDNRALVLAASGTTRDRLEAEINWQKKKFLLVDTGGLDPAKSDPYREAIIAQARAAQARAAVIVFVVDATVGVLPADRVIAQTLRRSQKKIILAVNKCDNSRRRAEAIMFEKLNLPYFPISAKSGVGVGDLLDAVAAILPQEKRGEPEAEISLALLGKPNVGKSSLLNRLYGEERMIVSPLPHTTRDAQDVLVQSGGKIFRVIDTAGIRRYSRRGDLVEELSVKKARQAASRADVAGIIIDVAQAITSQDKRLAEEISALGKGLFIVANKWDLIPEKDSATIEKYRRYLAANLPHLAWAPVIFTSAAAGTRVSEILDLAASIRQNLIRSFDQTELKNFLKKISARRPPTIGRGTRRPTLLALEQTGVNPLRFRLTIPIKTNLAESYKQFIVNSLRREFELEGVPIKLAVRERDTK